MTDDELKTKLSEATKDLLFQSEIDSPFEVKIFSSTEGKEINEVNLLELMGKPSGSKIEQYDLDTLFYWPVREQDWQSDKERNIVKRYQNLVSIIKDNIKEIKVFRVGKIEIDVYITGRAPSKNLICLSTKQLQT